MAGFYISLHPPAGGVGSGWRVLTSVSASTGRRSGGWGAGLDVCLCIQWQEEWGVEGRPSHLSLHPPAGRWGS